MLTSWSLFVPWRRLCLSVFLVGALGGPLAAEPEAALDAFFRAVTEGRVEVVQQGLSAHPEWLEAELFMGIRPLYRATVLGRDEVVEVLLKAGADVRTQTARGSHPLHASALHGYLALTERLLRAGAPVDPLNEEGQSPLFLAVRYGQPEVEACLLAAGASAQRSDRHGKTPLHYAAGLGFLESSRQLLSAGAEINVECHQGFTPLGLCRSWKRNRWQEVEELLVAHGAVDRRPAKAWPQPASPETGPEER